MEKLRYLDDVDRVLPSTSQTTTTQLSQDDTTPLSIATFAFLDLETTGIPDLEFFKTKIVEISIVACSKKQFLEATPGVLPRVLSKLTLLVNPYRMISPKASVISGLYNESVENEKKFDQHTTELLQSFLDQLQKPVCLVAHNGLTYDFPILQKELLKSSKLLTNNIYCLDSLKAFRLIDQMGDEPQEKKTCVAQAEDTKFNEFISRELEILTQSVPPQPTETPEITQVDRTTSPDMFNSLEEDAGDGDGGKRLRQQLNETTPKRKTVPVNERKVKDPAMRKPLFKLERKSFKLNEIYKRYFGAYPELQHQAEADVLALMKCAIEVRKEFAQFADSHAIRLNDIKPLGYNQFSADLLNN